jgi:hypothetical protein
MLKKRWNTADASVMRASITAVVLALLCVNACATLRLDSIPPPSTTAKLRVVVLPITGEMGLYGMALSHEQYSKLMYEIVGQHLRDTGIYEVVSQEDMSSAAGGRENAIKDLHWWLKDDGALLRQYGKALYADYVLLVTRRALTVTSWDYIYNIEFFNVETGMRYSVSAHFGASQDYALNRKRLAQKTFPSLYRKLFYDAKGDLLATAIRKGRLMPEEETTKPEPRETKIALAPPPVPQIAPATPEVAIDKKPAPIGEALQKPVPPVSTAQEEAKAPIQPPLKPTLEPPPATQTLPVPEPPVPEAKAVSQAAPAARLPDTVVKQPVPDMKKDTETPKGIAKIAPAPQPLLPAADKRKEFEKKLEHELQTETPSTDKAKLVVYDFDTVERLSVVALILTDALREELFILGQFLLVNRENMMQVMQELKLQHSGLVDEKEIVQLGKWLAANQAVTGRLAMLGNSYILQVKRTDIKTMGTLGLGTLRCSSGQEEELLSGMPILARKLIESKK